MSSDFVLWFKQQYGALPNIQKRASLKEEELFLYKRLAIIQIQLRKEEELQRMYDAALKTKFMLESV